MKTIDDLWFDYFIENFDKDQLQEQYNVTIFDYNYESSKYDKERYVIGNYIYQNVKITCITIPIITEGELTLFLDSTKRWSICNHIRRETFSTIRHYYDKNINIPIFGILYSKKNGDKQGSRLTNSTFALDIDKTSQFIINIDEESESITRDISDCIKNFIEPKRFGFRISYVLFSAVISDTKVDTERNFCTVALIDEACIEIQEWFSKKYDDSKKIKKAVDLLKSDITMESVPITPNPKSPICSEENEEQVEKEETEETDEKEENDPSNIIMMNQTIDFMDQIINFANKNDMNIKDYKTVISNCNTILKIISKYEFPSFK